MSKLSKEIREKVKCPQLDGGTEYGEWGALRLDQRKQIAELCKEIELIEKATRHQVCEEILQYLENSKIITPESPKERLKMNYDTLMMADSVNACLFDIIEFVKDLEEYVEF